MGARSFERRQYYCSPACGGGRYCRKEWYDTAVREAAALAERMGPGWKPNVWENLGWHYDVANGIGRITVDGNPVRSYTAWINAGVSASGGKGFPIQFIQSASDPEEAWGLVVQEARTFVSRINNGLADILNSN